MCIRDSYKGNVSESQISTLVDELQNNIINNLLSDYYGTDPESIPEKLKEQFAKIFTGMKTDLKKAFSSLKDRAVSHQRIEGIVNQVMGNVRRELADTIYGSYSLNEQSNIDLAKEVHGLVYHLLYGAEKGGLQAETVGDYEMAPEVVSSLKGLDREISQHYEELHLLKKTDTAEEQQEFRKAA